MAGVTSLAEVWIETLLKEVLEKLDMVTSLAEVWIETVETNDYRVPYQSHFPCGSVD